MKKNVFLSLLIGVALLMFYITYPRPLEMNNNTYVQAETFAFSLDVNGDGNCLLSIEYIGNNDSITIVGIEDVFLYSIKEIGGNIKIENISELQEVHHVLMKNEPFELMSPAMNKEGSYEVYMTADFITEHDQESHRYTLTTTIYID